MLSWRELPRFTLSGALGFSIYLFIFNKGSETLTAATGCILIATAPIITALMASAVFRERLTQLAWIALWLAFLGVLVLMLWNGSVSINAGVFWMLGAALAISAYNVIQRLYANGYTSLQITAYSFFTATVMLAGFLPESIRQIESAPLSHVIAVIFLGVFPSALAYLLWAKALSFAATTSDRDQVHVFDPAAFVCARLCGDQRAARRGNMDRRRAHPLRAGIVSHLRPAGREGPAGGNAALTDWRLRVVPYMRRMMG